MSTHNICLHKEVDKKFTDYNLRITELLDCALIGVCAVIRSNTIVDIFLIYLRKCTNISCKLSPMDGDNMHEIIKAYF